MIMVGAGTGLAPFRGFLQERAACGSRACRRRGRCCSSAAARRETDLLYADELRDYEEQGLVRVENAFSRRHRRPCRYVQEAMLDCADEVWDLLQRRRRVLVCGNAATIAPGVRERRCRTSSGRGPRRARPTRRPGWPGCARPTGSSRTSGAAEGEGWVSASRP